MHYITSLFRNGLDEPEHLFLAATSVSRILPSDAGIFKPLQFVTVSLPSFFNLVFKIVALLFQPCFQDPPVCRWVLTIVVPVSLS